MYERFSDLARKVMQFANEEAQKFNHEYIATEHILLALLRVTSGLGFVALLRMDVDINALRYRGESSLKSGSGAIIMGKLPQTPRGKKVSEYAIDEAKRMDHNYVGTEHLLLGLLRESEGFGNRILKEFGVTLDRARDVVKYLCTGSGKVSPL